MQDIILQTLYQGAVVLYQRAGAARPIIQCRVKLPGQKNKYERKSTGTQVLEEAVRFAEDRWRALTHSHSPKPEKQNAGEKVLERSRKGDLVLYLRLRTEKPIIHYRIRIPGEKGQYERRSTNHTDLRLARDLAERRYDELLLRQRQGVSVFAPTFNKMADSYLEWLERRVEKGTFSKMRLVATKGTINNYMRVYFGDKQADEITQTLIKEYHAWRRAIWEGTEEWPKGASVPKNLKRAYTSNSETSNNSTLRQIFRHAKQEDRIKQEEIPTFPLEEQVYRRRGRFTDEQLTAMFSAIDEHALKYQNDKRHGFSAFMFSQYVQILLHTGMRVGELNSLCWKDVVEVEHDGQTYMELHVDGKTGYRALIALPGARKAILTLRKFYKEVCLWAIEPHEPVIMEYRRKPAKRFEVRFKQLLRKLGLVKDAQGNELSLYSFRHTHITQRLLAGVNIHMLAKNVGNSVRMIERNYDHVRPRMNVAELLKNL